MARRVAQAEWTGDLTEGAGRVTIGGGVFEVPPVAV
jgi:hypothetical protein